MSSLLSSMCEVPLDTRKRELPHRIAESVVPLMPPTWRLVKEAQMRVDARTAILESDDWLTADEIAQVAALSFDNPRAQPNEWKKHGSIFAISHDGVEYFPAFGLDCHSGFRPLKGIAEVIKVFANSKGAWGMAYWFCSVNSFLGGKRPQDLIASHADRVVDAAKDAVQGMTHG
jgi:hypothetical protein